MSETPISRIPGMRLEEGLAGELGRMIGSTLKIARTKGGDYRTAWGVKTDVGLGRVVMSIVTEATRRKSRGA